MKRKAKQTGAGGRLRLGLLLASATAFLLAPAAVASAQNAHVIIEGSGSGNVIGVPPLGGEPEEINCEYTSPGPATGICDTNTSVGAGGLEFLRVEHEAAAGSEFAGWTVEEGATECEPLDEKCNVLLVGSEIKIKAVFEKEPEINSHVTIDGSGSGKVVGVSPVPGEPPIECAYVSPGPATGTCDAEAQAAGPFQAISVEAEPDPGYVFAGWTTEEGIAVGGCAEGTFCSIRLGGGGEIHLKATFEPPPVALNLTISGSGSGSFQCDTGSGPEGCEAEYPEGEVVTVIANEDGDSDFVAFSGDCDSVAGNECEVEMDAEKNVDAQFDLKTYAFTVNQTGEGTVLCGGVACAAEYTHGDEFEVTAEAAAEEQLASIVSDAGSCEKASPTEGSCDLTITGPSSVTVEFVSAATVATAEGNVFGEVPQTTTLESACSEVDLGEFIPNAGEDIVYTGTCLVEATATGEVNDLTAEDKTGNETGFLTQKPGSPFTLENALNVQGTALGGLGGESGAKEALTSPVSLVHYPTPVSGDDVEVEFSQLIGEHEPLHTGVYAKTITLTLEQTTP